jgi:hypothetical protein
MTIFALVTKKETIFGLKTVDLFVLYLLPLHADSKLDAEGFFEKKLIFDEKKLRIFFVKTARRVLRSNIPDCIGCDFGHVRFLVIIDMFHQ